MARVALVDPDRATGRAKEVFDRVESYYQMVPGLQKGLNYLPENTDALWSLSLATAIEGSIGEDLKRVFFAVTAHEVECEYCTAAHMLALLHPSYCPHRTAMVRSFPERAGDRGHLDGLCVRRASSRAFPISFPSHGGLERYRPLGLGRFCDARRGRQLRVLRVRSGTGAAGRL